MTYSLLAEAYLNSGDVERARAVIAAGESLTPTFPWERPQLDRVKASLEEQAASRERDSASSPAAKSPHP
jgi:hypothetical protein